MIVWLRHLLGWVVVRSVPVRISSLKISLFVSNYSLSTPNDLAGDSLHHTSCFGLCCEGLGWMETASHPSYSQNGRQRGIVLAFGCIGNGFHEPDRREVESL